MGTPPHRDQPPRPGRWRCLARRTPRRPGAQYPGDPLPRRTPDRGTGGPHLPPDRYIPTARRIDVNRPGARGERIMQALTLACLIGGGLGILLLCSLGVFGRWW